MKVKYVAALVLNELAMPDEIMEVFSKLRHELSTWWSERDGGKQ